MTYVPIVQPVAGQPVAGAPLAQQPAVIASQQYGAPAPQYGAPPPGAMPGPVLPPAEIKWSGLSTGGAFKIPVVCFIGRLAEMIEDSSSQYGLRIIEKYDQVQILESPVPWPWATVDLSIKYSDRESSGWGHHVESAKALGLAINATSLAEAKADLVGKVYEMRQTEQSYGEDRQTGQAMKGDVWKFVRIVTPGQAPAPAQYVTPAPAPTPVPVAVAPPTAAAPTPAPVPEQTVVAPPPATPPSAEVPGAFDVTLKPDDTSSIRAKKLLNGKALNEWLGVALIDDKIKADPSFINTIYDQSFIVGLKASNQITQGADGKFTVIA